MLDSIFKQTGNWNTEALAKIFGYNYEFCRSVGSNKEEYKNYLLDLISKDSYGITLPKEVIPDTITLYAFTFTHKKDPLILPILLKYFARKNLLKEAKDDLDKINQKLQSVMDKDLKDLQDKKTKLQEDKTNLNNVKMHSEEAKALAIDEIDKQITTTSSEIEKIELYKKDIETLLSGEEVKVNSYPLQYLSILKDGLTKVMEEKLKTYVEDNKADVEKTYHSLNSKAKKIMKLRNAESLVKAVGCAVLVLTYVPLITCVVLVYAKGASDYAIIVSKVMCSIGIAFLAISGVVYLVNRHYYEKNFAKKIENFVEGPMYISKTTNAENGEKPKQKETKVEDLIDFSCNNDECNDQVTPPAPPLEEEIKESYLYPNLEVPDSLSSSSFIPFNTTQQMR